MFGDDSVEMHLVDWPKCLTLQSSETIGKTLTMLMHNYN
jgi:hypothetical protein